MDGEESLGVLDKLDTPKIKQMKKYLREKDATVDVDFDGINEKKLKEYIEKSNSVKSIVDLFNDESQMLTFNYDYKEYQALYNVYSPNMVKNLKYSSILLDEEYLKFASVEWTQDVLLKSEKKLILLKNGFKLIKKNQDETIADVNKKNLFSLSEAKKEGRLEDAIIYLTDKM